MSKKRGLGKGIDALFASETSAQAGGEESLREVATEKIRAGKFQPRRAFPEESLRELEASVRARGVIQPIIVRKHKSGYEIVAGERRWQAAKRAGLKQVPVRVVEYDDRQALYAALVENLQREDLNVADLARGVRRLIDDFSLSHEQAAKGIGVARASVSNLLRILELHPAALKLVEQGDLEMGHARAIAALPKQAQKLAAEKVARKRLSVRETEELVRKLADPGGKGGKAARSNDPDVDALMEELSGKLGTKISLSATSKTQGRLIIHYRNLDALDRIVRKLKK